MAANEKEITGAWVIHHGRKLVLDANGAAEFPAIDEAAKAASLISKLGQADESILSLAEVRAIAVASGLNPRHELTGLLGVLQTKKLVDVAGESVAILGMTSRGALTHAHDIYQDAEPSSFEAASITLAEQASQAPVRKIDVAEKIGDLHNLSSAQVDDFLRRAVDIGFVDKEADGASELLFNGNLFRREAVVKAQRVLASLNSADARLVSEVAGRLGAVGCLSAGDVEHMLGGALFEKLVAAGVYDLNQVANEQGNHVFVTTPSAFHKFVDPMVDDCFDLAKALVAALMYGMTGRASSQGRIQMLPVLLGKLLNGWEIGPATAIGEDYRVLEIARVVKIRPDPIRPGRFYMQLLKRDIGELALEVLTRGQAHEAALADLPGAPMSGYVGPEASRVSVRKRQTPLSKQKTRDVLEAVRGGRF